MYEVKFKSEAEKAKIHMVVENALTCVEAVRMIVDNIQDADVLSVYLSNFKEIVRNQTTADIDHKWYDVTAASVCIDEISGKEKKLKYHILIDAPDFDTAVTRTKETLSQGYDMVTFSIKETDITDVI